MSSVNLSTFVPARILVCQLRQIGDVILSTPCLELLKRRYPESELHVFTEKKCEPVLRGNPHVTRIWSLDKARLKSFPTEILWYWKMARTGFDLVVDLQQLPRCRWVTAFSAARVRLSFTPPWYNRLLYTHRVDLVDGYAALCKASILAPLGIHATSERPRLYLAEEERQAAARLLHALGLRPEHRLVTLDPTHRRVTRRWPASAYAETLRLLADADPALRFLPLWGPGEEQEIRELVAACDCKDHILLPERMLSLREMAACIEAARLHLGNCSAPRHMAVAVGTPSCVIRGATSDGWTYPSPQHVTVAANLDCQPCNRNTCSTGTPCLTAVPPRRVADTVLAMLAANSETDMARHRQTP